MYFSAICIKAYGDRSNPELYPQIDEQGLPVVEPGDNKAVSAGFTNLLVKQGSSTVYESEHGLDGTLYITDSRIIFLCDDYESGGALWIGNPVITVIASVASSAMAKSRTAGTVLTGHIRYEWIEDIVPASEKLLFSLVDETITINYRDPFNTRWSLAVSLKNTKGLSSKIDAEIKKRFARFEQQQLRGRQEPIPLPPAGGAEPSDYIYCTQCGERLKASAAYCRRCGAKVK